MALRIFCDIETLPPEKEALVNFPKVCDCDEEEYRKLALTGDYGRVLTIGVIVERDGRVVHCGCLGRDRSSMSFHLQEQRTLRGWWGLLKEFDPRRDLIIGHNIFSFDLSFIYKRSVINRVQPTVCLSFARYRSQPIFDTMHEWNKWDQRRLVSLDELSAILGLESSKQGIDGSKIYDRFCEGEHAHPEIADYCMRDVKLTRRIYYRMTSPEGPEPLDELLEMQTLQSGAVSAQQGRQS
jgi:DNA polymerase elongation subunit (family B)